MGCNKVEITDKLHDITTLLGDSDDINDVGLYGSIHALIGLYLLERSQVGLKELVQIAKRELERAHALSN